MNKHSATQASMNAQRRNYQNGGFVPNVPTLHPEGMASTEKGYDVIRLNQARLIQNILSNPIFLDRQKHGDAILKRHKEDLGILAEDIAQWLQYVDGVLREMEQHKVDVGYRSLTREEMIHFYARCKFRSALIVFPENLHQAITAAISRYRFGYTDDSEK